MTDETLPMMDLSEAISSYFAANGELFFVQAGGFDGVSFDPLRPHIVEERMAGIIIEPLADNFSKLCDLYKDSTKIRTCNCAVSEEDGERTIWRFNPEAIARGILSPVFAGVSSLVMEDLLCETGTLGKLWTPEGRAMAHKLIEPVTVHSRSFPSIFAEYGVSRVDLLQIDTEGYDYNLLKCFDLAQYRPAIVHYECQHLSPEDRQAAEALLGGLGYRVSSNYCDALALRADFPAPRA